MPSRPLKHSEVVQLITAAADAKVINLDTSLRTLIEPAAATARNIGDEVALHIVCCNEYGLVTGLTADLNITDIRQQLESLRSTLAQRKI
jgi:hypothetical protein